LQTNLSDEDDKFIEEDIRLFEGYTTQLSPLKICLEGALLAAEA